MGSRIYLPAPRRAIRWGWEVWFILELVTINSLETAELLVKAGGRAVPLCCTQHGMVPSSSQPLYSQGFMAKKTPKQQNPWVKILKKPLEHLGEGAGVGWALCLWKCASNCSVLTFPLPLVQIRSPCPIFAVRLWHLCACTLPAKGFLWLTNKTKLPASVFSKWPQFLIFFPENTRLL